MGVIVRALIDDGGVYRKLRRWPGEGRWSYGEMGRDVFDRELGEAGGYGEYTMAIEFDPIIATQADVDFFGGSMRVGTEMPRIYYFRDGEWEYVEVYPLILWLCIFHVRQLRLHQHVWARRYAEAGHRHEGPTWHVADRLADAWYEDPISEKWRGEE